MVRFDSRRAASLHDQRGRCSALGACEAPRDYPREWLGPLADSEREGQSGFHALLVAVGKTTGRQMVLNTSFNVKGQPIVNTPDEAIETFLGTGIEFLFLENFHVTRSGA